MLSKRIAWCTLKASSLRFPPVVERFRIPTCCFSNSQLSYPLSSQQMVSFCTSNPRWHPEEQNDSGSDQKKTKKIRGKTPMGKLEELQEGQHPFQEKEPLKQHPGGVNPKTGEIGGPAGPEPTRYGDWERKGRVTDF